MAEGVKQNEGGTLAGLTRDVQDEITSIAGILNGGDELQDVGAEPGVDTLEGRLATIQGSLEHAHERLQVIRERVQAISRDI